MIYLVPADPTRSPITLAALRQRARRLDYHIHSDRYADSYTLVDAKLHLPVSGLEHVGLHMIANAVAAASAAKRKSAPKQRQRRRPDRLRQWIQELRS